MVSDVILFGLLELFFLISAILILRRLSKNNSTLLRKILVLTCFVGTGVAVFLGGAILNLTNVYGGYTAQKQFAVWTMIWSGYMILTGPQVFFFREPGVQSKSKVITNFSPNSKERSKERSKDSKGQDSYSRESKGVDPSSRESKAIDYSTMGDNTPRNFDLTPRGNKELAGSSLVDNCL